MMSNSGSPHAKRPGPIPRREFLRAGLTGLASLSLADLYRLPQTRPPDRRASVLPSWSFGCTAAPAIWRPMIPSPMRQ